MVIIFETPWRGSAFAEIASQPLIPLFNGLRWKTCEKIV
jgi:hypothetical protein